MERKQREGGRDITIVRERKRVSNKGREEEEEKEWEENPTAL